MHPSNVLSWAGLRALSDAEPQPFGCSSEGRAPAAVMYSLRSDILIRRMLLLILSSVLLLSA